MATSCSSVGEKKSAARARWQILKKAIYSDVTNSSRSDSNTATNVSVRSFSSFDLFQVRENKDESGEGVWSIYSFPKHSGSPLVSAHVKLLPQKVSLDSLTGFNNTGNVCVWPSEEVMAYHCLKERLQFEGKSVVELGGGMTCLAGLMLSLTGLPLRVCLTDGNTTSVENLKAILAANCKNINKVEVVVEKLVWDKVIMRSECTQYDYVICADCLFFTDLHGFLAELISRLLVPGGKALLFNPHRSGTLLRFIELVKRQGEMEVSVEDNYDQEVWAIHQKLRAEEEGSYRPDLHYPIMVTLTSR